jgi:hypothetical protein
VEVVWLEKDDEDAYAAMAVLGVYYRGIIAYKTRVDPSRWLALSLQSVEAMDAGLRGDSMCVVGSCTIASRRLQKGSENKGRMKGHFEQFTL